jgi:hypothetical protein
VGSTFLGFSFEYPALEQYAGTDPNAVDPVFEQLISNLTDGRPTLIRIGGISTDRVWWPVEGVPRTPAAYYTLTRRRLEVAAALARATNAHLIFGVNMEAGSPIEASAESRAIMTVIGRTLLKGIEIGNEPELYGSKWYYKIGGREYFARPASWDFQSFMSEYLQFAAALGQVPLVGPAIGAHTWMPYLSEYLDQEHPVVVTLHRYPLQSCGPKPGQPKYPSIPHLLSLRASVGLADQFQPYVQLAHARGELVRNGEMNSVSCGLAWGSANTFAGALWLIDTLFALANVGVDGVNLHTYPGASDQLFAIKQIDGRWRAYVAPEYYGALMFSQAAPPGSHLLQVSGVSDIPTVRAWATRTPSGQIHLVLLNDATNHPQRLTVRLLQSMGPATLERLRAPRVSSTIGITIDGQTIRYRTTTGLLSGRFRDAYIAPVAGTYNVYLPTASAAMLTFDSASGQGGLSFANFARGRSERLGPRCRRMEMLTAIAGPFSCSPRTARRTSVPGSAPRVRSRPGR